MIRPAAFRGASSKASLAGLGRAQPGFKLTKSQFNKVEIGRTGRQVQQPEPTDLDRFSQAGRFVRAQVIGTTTSPGTN